ncbi:MAG: hypothetical protein EOO93_00050 [Pedobacter sp.]|nr:MAG: hypothetical protein EOO93_00050 [Pedobacter sp.]
MKPFAIMCAVILGLFMSSCNSENNQQKMNDTSVGADSDFMNLDTGRSMTDTAGMDSLMNNNNGTDTTGAAGSNNRGSSNQ